MEKKLTEITFESFRQYRKLVLISFFPLRLLCLTKHHKSQHTPQNLRSILDTRKYQIFLEFLSRPIKLEYGTIQHQYKTTLFLFLFLAKGFWKISQFLSTSNVSKVFSSLSLLSCHYIPEGATQHSPIYRQINIEQPKLTKHQSDSLVVWNMKEGITFTLTFTRDNNI